MNHFGILCLYECIYAIYFVLDICQPGTYSNTRVVPCSVCGIGEYQPLKGSSTCLKCTKGKFTTTLGATDVSDCKGIYQTV